MAKLSITILSRNKRADGSYPVQLRLFHKQKHKYIDTSILAREHELERERDSSGKYKESVWKIKDRALFRRVDTILRDYEDAMLKLNTDSMTADEIKNRLVDIIRSSKLSNTGINIITFIDERIDKLREQGKHGSADNTRTMRNALIDHFGRPIIFSQEISSKELRKFYAYVQTPRIITRQNHKTRKARQVPGVSKTTAYNYLKELRTVFNAMRKEFNNEENDVVVIRNYPFSKLEEELTQPLTEHRAATIDDVVKLYKLYKLYNSLGSREKIGLDMFFLSFFLAGLNSVDVYNMPKASLAKKGRLSYNRSKTKDKRKDRAFISIAIRPEAMAIIERYRAEKGDYLFNLRDVYADRRGFSRAINTGLKSLCEKIEIAPLTHYVARHTWATIARNDCNISMDDIGMALNHANNTSKTTDIYVAPDYSRIDNANNKVVDLLISRV